MTPALADYTTLGLGGRARSFVSAATEAELIDAVKVADAAAEPALLIGGGSNLVISDAGFPGTVIHVNTRGLRSAVAAGIDCVIVHNDFTSADDFSLASHRIETLGELRDLVLAAP